MPVNVTGSIQPMKFPRQLPIVKHTDAWLLALSVFKKALENFSTANAPSLNLVQQFR